MEQAQQSPASDGEDASLRCSAAECFRSQWGACFEEHFSPLGNRRPNREILERLEGEVDIVIASGSCGVEPTTVVDLTGEYPAVLRHGKGDPQGFS